MKTQIRFFFAALLAAVMFNVVTPGVSWAQEAPGPESDPEPLPTAAPITAAPPATAPAVLKTVRFICVPSQPGQTCPTVCAQLIVNNPGGRMHSGRITCDSYPCDFPVASMGITTQSAMRVILRASSARSGAQVAVLRATDVGSPMVVRFQVTSSDAGYSCPAGAEDTYATSSAEPEASSAPADAAPPTPPAAEVCGNGALEGSEECDDGNTTDGDGCNEVCIRELRYACATPGQPCVHMSKCGNGWANRNPDEECDDGNVVNLDGCDDACQFEPGWEVRDVTSVEKYKGKTTHWFMQVCGNGVVTKDEECDDGAANSNTNPNACRANCTKPFCGDGVVDTELDEECDSGRNNSDTVADACRSTCKRAWCGDGQVDTDEECDNGTANNNTAPDACRTTCKKAECGDGVVDTGEVCDTALHRYCNSDCSAIVGRCGDNIRQLETGEQCDDGNTQDGDGCDTQCRTEAPREETEEDGRRYEAYNFITLSWVSGVMWGDFQPKITRIGRRPVASAQSGAVLTTGLRLSFTPILGKTGRWFPVLSGQWNMNGGLDDQGHREWSSKINTEITAGVGRCFLDQRTLCVSLSPLFSYQSTGLELVQVRNANGNLEKKDWFSSIGVGGRASGTWQFSENFFMGADVEQVNTVKSLGVLNPGSFWITWFSLGVTPSP